MDATDPLGNLTECRSGRGKEEERRNPGME